MIFTPLFLAFLSHFSYNLRMVNLIEISLKRVVKISDFGRQESPKLAHSSQAFSSVVQRVLHLCERAIQNPKEHPSGFGVALRRTDCAALLWQPGTHPRQVRSAVF